MTWRYHSASLVAVFVALAVGVAGGGLLLHGTVVSDLHRQVREARHDSDAARAQASRAAADGAQAQALVDQLGGLLLPGRLANRSVTIISTPGITDAVRRPLALAVATAGGTVVGDVRLAPTVLDPTTEGVLSDVAARLVPAGVTLPSDPVGAAMTVLAAATAGPVGNAVSATDPVTVLAALHAANLTLVGTRTDSAAGLVLILAPPGASNPASTSLVTALAAAYSGRHAAVVVASAGPAAASLHAVRTAAALSGTVSSLDHIDATGSSLRAVLALAAAARGVVGHYGGEGETAAAPPT